MVISLGTRPEPRDLVWFCLILGCLPRINASNLFGLECAKVRRNENTHVIGKWIL